jgi:hypothetical protein
MFLKMFLVYGAKCLSRKAIHNWVEKFSQGRSKVADDARPGRPVQTATEATVQQVEKLIRADRRIMIDSVATALGCYNSLALSFEVSVSVHTMCAQRTEGSRDRLSFDSLRGEVLYNILIEFGIPMKLVRLIKMCLNETYSKARTGNYLSDHFPIQNGLKQGGA